VVEIVVLMLSHHLAITLPIEDSRKVRPFRERLARLANGSTETLAHLDATLVAAHLAVAIGKPTGVEGV